MNSLVDCAVELAIGSKWPAYFSSHNADVKWPRTDGVNYSPDQIGPACDVHNNWYTDGDGKPIEAYDGHTGWLFRVTTPPKASGLSCEIAAKNKLLEMLAPMRYLNYFISSHCINLPDYKR